MRKAVGLAVLVLLMLAGGLLVLGGDAPRSVDGAADGRGVASPVVAVERPSARAVPASEPERASPQARAEREQMRRRILEAMHARERAVAERDGVGSSDGGDPTPEIVEKPGAVPGAPNEPAPAPGNLTDRTGEHGYLMKVMNEDLMPLADECYALARETQPALAGMLVLDFEIIGDEDVGGVIETVALGQGNELVDPGLVECMQESILSTTLPPPPPEHGGRDAVSLSLRLSPDE